MDFSKPMYFDRITIGFEDFVKELREIVADMEDAATAELLLNICVDFAKLHISPDYIEHLFNKTFKDRLAELRELDKADGSERVKRVVDFVTRLTQYIDREIVQLKLLAENEYVPYRFEAILGGDTIVLAFRAPPTTNLENPESRRFDPLECDLNLHDSGSSHLLL